ncbi:MAG: hypothetical protein SH848_17415 [Saprospiraceae bacterium]|nr:hypothetical protein [Saprospiraceae bacterium]MDZ4705710.1 hypothetical protein [Saprospiraceae bacterium]
METALANAAVLEMYGYGRQLVRQKKYKEGFAVFEKNFKKNGNTWATHVGMMRGYSAIGDFKNALKHAKLALVQAPDDVNKNSLTMMIKALESGKPVPE